jgi:TRAP-type transport system periplasmic protein
LRALIALVLAVLPAAASAETVLRLAAIAPEGTAWARELNAFKHDVQATTNGQLKIKMFFGGSTGDEIKWMDHFAKGHLDGAVGGLLCERIAPSMRVLRVPGLFQSREEATHLMNRMLPQLQAEGKKAGFAFMGTAALGADILFTRKPVRTLAELRQTRLWRWQMDTVGIAASRALGIDVVPAAINDAGRLYETGATDGFVAIPVAALAFQWSVQARYFTDLHTSYIVGCVIIRDAAYDGLPLPVKEALKASLAKLRIRMIELGRAQDAQLVGGLFEKQGMKAVPASASFRSEFYRAASEMRDKFIDQWMPRALVDRVVRELADYRGEHR